MNCTMAKQNNSGLRLISREKKKTVMKILVLNITFSFKTTQLNHPSLEAYQRLYAEFSDLLMTFLMSQHLQLMLVFTNICGGLQTLFCPTTVSHGQTDTSLPPHACT